MIVNVFPFISQILRLHHSVHNFPGNLLMPKLRIKLLNKTVLPRRTWIDKRSGHPNSGAPFHQRASSELRPVIAPHKRRLDPGFSNDALHNSRYINSLERPARNDRQSGPRVLINDIEEPDMTAARGHVRLKIEAEHCIGDSAVNRFCSPAFGPVRRFFRRLGLQTRPSSGHNRLMRLMFNTVVAHRSAASRYQRALHQPRTGCLDATALRSDRRCTSSKLIGDFFLGNKSSYKTYIDAGTPQARAPAPSADETFGLDLGVVSCDLAA